MQKARSFLCSEPAETRELGSRLGALLRAGDVLCLSGPLGAGKTCLVQGIALGLGVAPDVPVTSPTFTLIGEYPGRVPLRHADFYRIEDEGRLFDLGFDDELDGTGVVVVEWGERWLEHLPSDRLDIRIDIVVPDLGPPAAAEMSEDRRARRIELCARGDRGRLLVEGLVGPDA